MNNLHTASNFIGTSAFKNNEFESLLTCCVSIYYEFITYKFKCENKEEKIRDIFFACLSDDIYRKQQQILLNYHFEKEPQEKTGYLDIKVKTLNPYLSTKAFYCIECKKLGSDSYGRTSCLNAEYIKNGICRFVEDYYTSYFGCNAMFGFIINNVDIQTEIINDINSKLNKKYKKYSGQICKSKCNTTTIIF